MRRIYWLLLGWLVPVGLLLAVLCFSSHPILPQPQELWHGLWRLSLETTWYPLALTSLRSLLAFLLALTGGILWAAIFRETTRRGQILYPLLLLLQAAPVLLWIVPLVLLLDTGHTAPVVAAFLVVLPLMALEFRGVFAAAGTERREFWRHYVPAFFPRLALRLYYDWRPHLAAAAGMGLLLSFKASVMAEWFAAREGIGRRWQQAFTRVDMSEFFLLAALFLTTALSANALAQGILKQAGCLKHFYRPQMRQRVVPHLKFDNVSFAYGEHKILQDASLQLFPGQLLILTGDSGCGKSTLARLAAGLLRPDSGTITSTSGAVCLMFQGNFIFGHESVLENTSFFWPQRSAQACDILHEVGLAPDIPANELSGGMRRRLSLARALLSPAPFLVLDEPFNGLHKEAIQNLITILHRELHKGRGILLIAHQLPPEVTILATKICRLREGKLYLVL